MRSCASDVPAGASTNALASPRGALPCDVISGAAGCGESRKSARLQASAAARRLLRELAMSEEPVKPAANAPAAAKTSKIVVALLLLNLGASGFSTFKLVTAQPAAAATAHEPPPEVPSSSEVTGPVVGLSPFVVNLDEPQSRYLKVTIQFELVKGDVEAVLKKNEQVIRDAILRHLSGLKLADTLGSEAKDKLRVDILKKTEEIIGEHKVRRMFFQDFVVQ